MPERVSAITTRKLPRSAHAACMSKLMPHEGDMFEVELPMLVVPEGKAAFIYLCQRCLADLIVHCAVDFDDEV